MTPAEQLMRDEAIYFARSNKKAIARRRKSTIRDVSTKLGSIKLTTVSLSDTREPI